MKTRLLFLVLALTASCTGQGMNRYERAPSPAPPSLDQGPAGVPSYMVNFAVTQATIRSTVCVAGWTATIRPPSSYTNALKRAQLAERKKRVPSTNLDPRAWQEDHTMPLTLGGSARNPLNLSPIPWATAYRKDAVARRLNRRVCSGSVRLDDARRMMLRWELVP